MLTQFSIWPLDQPHVSKDVRRIKEILDEQDIGYEIGAVSTTLEGGMDQTLAALRACHSAVRGSHARVVMSVLIDDDAAQPQTIEEAKAKVNR